MIVRIITPWLTMHIGLAFFVFIIEVMNALIEFLTVLNRVYLAIAQSQVILNI